ncbi:MULTISPECIES: hypothetical protein [Sphingobacterium]|uniref:Uncharacterized protein n=2 Tax=Sphingobacterium multivorum TaxID=28454 RepID=A0A654D3X7_SPHMU|nr:MULTISPECIES: hypothetical protein [Sphingobacterium]QQT45036.1 hypothetical protein I6J00_25675 [Sphingobacterium multivorum]QQT62306.1 hypothetical protein I6I97_00265 [Sphingobacterium multivorum]QRQ59470.1 hypothetical protein I6J33_14825 [Sphingobacterium multivorum]VXD00145.1 conserved exported hypothetical protein [Sphingobacterium multivorum]
MLIRKNMWYLLIILPMMALSCKSKIAAHQSIPPYSLADTVKPDWYREYYGRVVMIDNDFVTQKDGNYLVDLPLQIVPDSTYVFFLSTKIPVELLKKSNEFYPDLQHFVLIVPDWKFYGEVAEEASKNGMCIEPATTNFYYSIKREDGMVKVDSLRLSGLDNPRLDFVKPISAKGMLTIYRRDSYGSVCCPRDPKWDNADKDELFLRDFEHRSHLKVTKGRYVQMEGKEGEKSIYYTLPGLSSAQRLEFLANKYAQWIANKDTGTRTIIPQLFAPQIIPMVTEGFNKMKELP